MFSVMDSCCFQVPQLNCLARGGVVCRCREKEFSLVRVNKADEVFRLYFEAHEIKVAIFELM